jgi:hypothetical protein
MRPLAVVTIEDLPLSSPLTFFSAECAEKWGRHNSNAGRQLSVQLIRDGRHYGHARCTAYQLSYVIRESQL